METNMDKATFINQTTIHETTIWMPSMPNTDAAEKIKAIVDDAVKKSKDLIDALQMLVTHGWEIIFNPYNGTYSLSPDRNSLAEKQCYELAQEQLTETERFRLTKSEKERFGEYAAKYKKTKSDILRDYVRSLIDND